MRKKLKPNRRPLGEFLISIDDGYVEYTYGVTPRSKHHSIDSLYTQLRRAVRAKKMPGVIREIGLDYGDEIKRLKLRK